MCGGRSEMYIQYNDCHAYTEKNQSSLEASKIKCTSNRVMFKCLPKRVEYHREQYKLAQKWND